MNFDGENMSNYNAYLIYHFTATLKDKMLPLMKH